MNREMDAKKKEMAELYEKFFKPQYLEMSIINLKYRTDKPLTDEQYYMFELMSCLKPIVDRLMKNKTMKIDDVLKGELCEAVNNNVNNMYTHTVQHEQKNVYVPEPYKKYWTSETVATKKQEEEEETLIEDKEGDERVEKMTMECIKHIHRLRETGWILIQAEDSEDSDDSLIESSTDTLSTDEDEGEGDTAIETELSQTYTELQAYPKKNEKIYGYGPQTLVPSCEC